MKLYVLRNGFIQQHEHTLIIVVVNFSLGQENIYFHFFLKFVEVHRS